MGNGLPNPSFLNASSKKKTPGVIIPLYLEPIRLEFDKAKRREGMFSCWEGVGDACLVGLWRRKWLGLVKQLCGLKFRRAILEVIMQLTYGGWIQHPHSLPLLENE